MTCIDCAENTEHCHEILAVHVDGTFECVESDCSGGLEAHDWIYACADLAWDCHCTRTGHRQPLAA